MKAIVSFGRLNPPTLGHSRLFEKINENVQADCVPFMFLSQSYDRKKNPLSWEFKLDVCSDLFDVDYISKERSVKNPFDALKYVNSLGFNEVVFISGSDRIADFNRQFNRYNGEEFKFDSIEVVSAGMRDSKSDDIDGISASRMRKFALDDNFQSFLKFLPKRTTNIQAKTLFDAVKTGLKNE